MLHLLLNHVSFAHMSPKYWYLVFEIKSPSKISVNIWYIDYSLAHLIGRSQNGVLETVAQFSCSWVANTFWGSWNFTKVTRLWPKLPFAGSQNLLVSFASTEAWPVRKLGSKWEPHTNMAGTCVYVCRSHQTSNKQITNKQQVCEVKNDKINAKQSYELKCELYMLKKFCKWP